MADPITELRVAIVDHLRTTPGLPLTYDQAPQGNQAIRLPWITLGPMTYTPELIDCIDGGEIMIQVDVWSEKPGQAESTALAGLVRKSLLGFSPVLSDNALVEFSHMRTDFLLDGDIKHAAIRFTAIVEEP